MLVGSQLEAITLQDLRFLKMQKHIRIFVLSGISSITALAMILTYPDYMQVAGVSFTDLPYTEKLDAIGSSGFPLTHDNMSGTGQLLPS